MVANRPENQTMAVQCSCMQHATYSSPQGCCPQRVTFAVALLYSPFAGHMQQAIQACSRLQNVRKALKEAGPCRHVRSSSAAYCTKHPSCQAGGVTEVRKHE